MAILLTTEKISHDYQRTELRNKFRNEWKQIERNFGYVDAVDELSGIDFDTTHESVMIQLSKKVNDYIHIDKKIPKGMRVYIQDNFDLYIYSWDGGYLLQVPRVYNK